MTNTSTLVSRIAAAALAVGMVTNAFAVAPVKKKPATRTVRKTAAKVVARPTTVKSVVAGKTPSKRRKVWVQTWDEPTYKDSTAGDAYEGEDMQVRHAAVEALGPLNGAVVVVDPDSGRVLSMVNQDLALGGGFQPCSTIKIPVALAGLREGLVDRVSPIKFFRKGSPDLTDAIAFSSNGYFANMGIKLGYEKVNYYARLFGYGEKAGLGIQGEHPGYFPPAPPKNGGMGMLTSFGEEISQTPLELAGVMTAIANGGTLYWLQYPKNQEEVQNFQPQVKRRLDIARFIPDIKPGMRGAVEFGTARRAKQEEEIFGKTGTCSEGRTHLGWFGSFHEGGGRKLVVVVMLTGGRPSIGPLASGVAGDVYRKLTADGFFKASTPLTPATILPGQFSYR